MKVLVITHKFRDAYEAVEEMRTMNTTELKNLHAVAANKIRNARRGLRLYDAIGWTTVMDLCERRLNKCSGLAVQVPESTEVSN